MGPAADGTTAHTLVWWLLGVPGGVIFYGRFYVQWIASEIRKKSVMPVAFWYMSTLGGLMLFAYAVYDRVPLGALGQCLSITVYCRNLIHIRREKGSLSRLAHFALHAGVALVTFVAILLTIGTWLSEYEATKDVAVEEVRETWFWLGVGLVGQILFAARFLVQWIATEKQRKSVVPTAFWRLSVVASTLQLATFTQRREWIFAAGMIATLLIYLRNLWFIRSKGMTDTE